MRIEKHTKFDRVSERNSFGQYITTGFDTEYTTVYGTLAEALEYSHSNPCYVHRTPATEHLFRSWDDYSKFACLYNGKADTFADRKADIPGAGYYTHEFVIEDD